MRLTFISFLASSAAIRAEQSETNKLLADCKVWNGIIALSRSPPSTLEIETERLILKPLQLSNYGDFLTYRKASESDPKWMDDGRPVESLRESMKTQIRGDGFRFLVVEKKSKKVIGQVSMKSWNRWRQANIGYEILRTFRKKGYAYEAAYAAIQFYFSSDVAEKLTAISSVDNEASKQLLIKLGFDLVTTYSHDIHGLAIQEPWHAWEKQRARKADYVH